MKMLLLGCAVGGLLVGVYALLTREQERPLCPPDCPVCQANALVVEEMRQAGGQGWDCW